MTICEINPPCNESFYNALGVYLTAFLASLDQTCLKMVGLVALDPLRFVQLMPVVMMISTKSPALQDVCFSISTCCTPSPIAFVQCTYCLNHFEPFCPQTTLQTRPNSNCWRLEQMVVLWSRVGRMELTTVIWFFIQSCLLTMINCLILNVLIRLKKDKLDQKKEQYIFQFASFLL